VALASGGDDDEARKPQSRAHSLGIIFFALPIIIRHVSAASSRPKPQAQQDFLAAPVETATGPLTGASAWLQVLIIPLSLALAATLIGAASVLVR
jgi:hypothetical protein